MFLFLLREVVNHFCYNNDVQMVKKKKKTKIYKNMYIYIYEREIPDFEKLSSSLLTKVMKIN